VDDTGRGEARATLDQGHEALEALFARLSTEQMEEPATIGGGEWSAKDLRGHIAFWEELAAEAANAWREGRRPEAEDIFATDAEGVHAANARNFERTRLQTVEAVNARARKAHGDVLSLVDNLSDEEWASKAPYETERRRTLGTMLGSILGAPKRPFGHAFAHVDDLRAYVESATGGG
jgi:hypothetical protein